MTMRWRGRKKNRKIPGLIRRFVIEKRTWTAVLLSVAFLLSTTVPAETIQTYGYDFYGLYLRIPERMEDYCFEVYVDLTTLMQDHGYVLWGNQTGETEEREDGFKERYYTAAEYWSGDHRVRGILRNDTTRDVAENDYSGGWSVTLQTVWRTVVFSAENTDPEASSLMIFPEDPMSDILPERISREQLVLFLWGLERMRTDPKEDPLEGLQMVPDRSWTDENEVRHTTYVYDYEELFSGILASEEARQQLSPQEELLSQIAYIGDRSLCQMSPEMAEAYADKIRELQAASDPKETEPCTLDGILVDVGGDGQPLLLISGRRQEASDAAGETMASFETCIQVCGRSCLCSYENGEVEEIRLDEEYGDFFSENQPSYSIYASSVPYLTVRYSGTLNDDSGRNVVQENYYQVSGGNLCIAHTGLVIREKETNTAAYFFDGKQTGNLETARMTAGIGTESGWSFLFSSSDTGLKTICGTECEELTDLLRNLGHGDRFRVPSLLSDNSD